MYPEEEECEDRDNTTHPETARIKKDVIEHDVHDHRAEEGQAERNKASDEQEQTAADLNTCDGVNVATAKECADELAGQTLHWRHRNEVKEGVGPEDSEHDPEQDSHDADGVFHNPLSPNHLDLPIKFFFRSRSLRNGKRSVKPKVSPGNAAEKIRDGLRHTEPGDITDARRESSQNARLRETYCKGESGRRGPRSVRGSRISRRPLGVCGTIRSDVRGLRSTIGNHVRPSHPA